MEVEDKTKVGSADPEFGAAHEQMDAARNARLVQTDEPPESGLPEVVEAAAAHPSVAKNMSGEEVLDAMEWLLSADPWGGATPKATYEVNVGTDEQIRTIKWTIRPVDADEMNRLRQEARAEASGNRQQRRAARGDADSFNVSLFNKRLVASATVEPDLQDAATRRGLDSADPLYGATMLLESMFQHKPGLLDQLAGYVMLLSGFDEDDVARAKNPESTMVKATGN